MVLQRGDEMPVLYKYIFLSLSLASTLEAAPLAGSASGRSATGLTRSGVLHLCRKAGAKKSGEVG